MASSLTFHEPSKPLKPPSLVEHAVESDDDDEDDEHLDRRSSHAASPDLKKVGVGKDSAKGLLTPASVRKYSVNDTTLSNTNSNSLLYRRSSDDAGVAHSTPRRKSSATSSTSTAASPFQKRISFDTISQPSSSAPVASSPLGFRFSLSAASTPYVGLDETACYSVTSKHTNHHTSYWSRSFLCSMSSLRHSLPALRWLVQNVMENGDELICLRIAQQREQSPKAYQDEAETMLRDVVAALATTLEIKVVVELWVGSIKKVVRQTMELYQPALVVVGTSTGMYGGSMKRYVKKRTLGSYLLAHSVVPVIVIVGDKEGQANVMNGPSGKNKVKRRTSSEVSDLDLPQLQPQQEQPPGEFNYLASLINRPTVEDQQVDNDPVGPSFNYKSLFQTGSAKKPNGSTSNLDPLAPPSPSSATPPPPVTPTTVPSITLHEPTISFADTPVPPSRDFGVEPYHGGASLGTAKSASSIRPTTSASSSNANSLHTSLSADASRSGKNEKRPSWSARLIPKSLRRFSATSN